MRAGAVDATNHYLRGCSLFVILTTIFDAAATLWFTCPTATPRVDSFST